MLFLRAVWEVSLIVAVILSFNLGRIFQRRRQNANEDLARHVRDRQNGSFVLEMIIGMGVLLVLCSLSIPSIVEMTASAEQRRAAEAIRQISQAEFFYNQRFGSGYVDLTTLTSGSPASPTCMAPAQTYAGYLHQPGYSISMVAGPDAPAVGGCPTSYLSYVLTAQPLANSPAHRYFFLSSADGILRFSDGSPASITSQPMTWE